MDDGTDCMDLALLQVTKKSLLFGIYLFIYERGGHKDTAASLLIQENGLMAPDGYKDTRILPVAVTC